ncbi:MAG: 3,4-dihydroxy-2-butanone-4-phosphate synthase, partial [Pseudomonadota bacterium]
VVVDDTERENEGDLIIAAEKITAAQMAFLVRHSSGVVCVALDADRLKSLALPLMVPANQDSFQTAFTVTVDCIAGNSTGISAADRARTLRALARPQASAAEFSRPGHIFPLQARKGGVTARQGHTEAAYDLARLAGLSPAGVLCEIVNDDGSMARRPDLFRFAAQHQLPIITIADLKAYIEEMGVEEAALLAQSADHRFSVRPAMQSGKQLLDAAILYAG